MFTSPGSIPEDKEWDISSEVSELFEQDEVDDELFENLIE